MRDHYLPRRAAAAALAAALLLTPASASFSDTEDHWAGGLINIWSQEYHLINGYEDGTFRPEDPITRGAFAGILDRLMQYRQSSPAETFTDTPGTYWESQILKLHAANVYLGNDGKALPQNSITRQQAVTMIVRAFSLETPEESALAYYDSGDIADYARGAVAELTNRGYITDCWDGNFRPQAPITRAEFVSILGNMIQLLVQTNEEHTGEVYGSAMINSAEGATLKDMTIHGDLIIAPGVMSAVNLIDVEISGKLRNFSGIEPVVTEKEDEPAKKPEGLVPPVPGEPLKPENIYVPGKTTGETFSYDNKPIPVYEGVERNTFSETDFSWIPVENVPESEELPEENAEPRADESLPEGELPPELAEPAPVPDRLQYVGDQYRTRFGIDVSAYQNRATPGQTIDWEAAKADGVEFVMVRAGLRGTSTGAIHEDVFLHQNVQGAMAAGLDTGVYFFAQAITVEEALEEADFVIELLKNEKITGPVAYDWEMHDSSYRVYGTPPEMATACAVAFCQRIEEAGYKAMIYAGQYVNYLKYDQAAIEPYARWYPEYKSQKSEKLCPQLFYQPDYWQFSSSCTVDGISGKVDGNLQFLPLEQAESVK